MDHHMYFLPHPSIYFVVLLLVLGVVLAIVRYVLVALAFQRLGLSRRGALAVLFGSLLGSGVNIPVAEFPARLAVQPGVVDFFGIQYVVPQVVRQGETVLAVNLGGAIIPLAVVAYLIARRGLSRRALAVTAIVTAIIHFLAVPVPGVGIALPPLLPPILVAALALLSDPQEAPRTAYLAGTLGTLIGADLLNLGVIRDLGAPVASIGGAGVFDGIFLIGVFAVLLTAIPSVGRGLFRRRPAAPSVETGAPPSDRHAA
jgi:uncharacterized membrane protein